MTAADVLIIGAGPAGATAGAILNKRGFTCRIIERAHFPRFSIGESLLPQCMDFLDEAGLLEAVQEARFQLKDGARFLHHGQYATFYFNDQYTPGWDHTFEVVRADFDKILADEAERQGVAITYGQQIDAVRFTEDGVALTATDESGTTHAYEGRFLLDASGFGRVLPRLLDLERPSTFPARRAFFTHIEDRIDHADFDRDKILVTIHPEHQDVWIWLIPFSNGRASVGVVAEESFLEAVPGDAETKLKTLIGEDDTLREILGNAVFDTPVNTLFGYSTNVSQMCGDRFALLGNAGEFLDPIFSSGVTIALRSASMAAAAVEKTLNSEPVDWDAEFTKPLGAGVAAFKAFVETWYEGSLQQVFFAAFKQPSIKQMICSILAGYAWDTTNPYNSRSKSRIQVLAGHTRAG